jgi:hypothetical protein
VVDIEHAREVYESGGELTYDEANALLPMVVYTPVAVENHNSPTDSSGEVERFRAKEREFEEQLSRSRLKESIGWVAEWGPEGFLNPADSSDTWDIRVYMYDPFADPYRDYGPYWHDLNIVGVDPNRLDGIKYGQQIRFSGPFTDSRDSENGIEAVTPDLFELLPYSTPDPSVPTGRRLASLHVGLRRSDEFGGFPNSDLTIKGDGLVVFEGRSNVWFTGTTTTKLDPMQIVELIDEIKKVDLDSLLGAYPYVGTEGVGVILSVALDGKSWTIVNPHNGPRRLKILVNRIDQISGTAQWIHGPPRTPTP